MAATGEPGEPALILDTNQEISLDRHRVWVPDLVLVLVLVGLSCPSEPSEDPVLIRLVSNILLQ